MAKEQQIRSRQLLKALEADFGRRKREAEVAMAKAGLEAELSYSISPPSQYDSIATFAEGTSRPLSPMLTERFQYASDITRGLDVWAGIGTIASMVQSEHVQSLHTSLREHWVDSAPYQFSDDSLSLFGYTIDVPENIVYLAWAGEAELRVYVYSSQSEERFDNLDTYLQWCLERP